MTADDDWGTNVPLDDVGREGGHRRRGRVRAQPGVGSHPDRDRGHRCRAGTGRRRPPARGRRRDHARPRRARPARRRRVPRPLRHQPRPVGVEGRRRDALGGDRPRGRRRRPGGWRGVGHRQLLRRGVGHPAGLDDRRAGPEHAEERFKGNLEVPFGWFPQPVYFATIARRHMHQYGTTEAQLGAIAVACREHANATPTAVMHGRPLSLDDYLASPYLAEPFRKEDCCLISDGGRGLRDDHARAGPRPGPPGGRGGRGRPRALPRRHPLGPAGRLHQHAPGVRRAGRLRHGRASTPATSTWPRPTTPSPSSA